LLQIRAIANFKCDIVNLKKILWIGSQRTLRRHRGFQAKNKRLKKRTQRFLEKENRTRIRTDWTDLHGYFSGKEIRTLLRDIK
jgi:hypothetical protein